MDKEEKAQFINELGELLAKYRINNIERMGYRLDILGDETLFIHYEDEYVKKINIKFDSLSAIIKDIVKQGGLD